LFRAVGRLRPPPSGLLFSSACFSTAFFLTSHVTTTFCCLSTPARSFRRCLSPDCTTSPPFTLRRASHFKPPNILYIFRTLPSSLHCKIHTAHLLFVHSCFLTRFLSIRFTAYSVAIRVPSDTDLCRTCNVYSEYMYIHTDRYPSHAHSALCHGGFSN